MALRDAVVADDAGDAAAPRPVRARRGGLRLDLRLSGTSSSGNAEHVVLVGASQMGKSSVAHSILSQLRNLVIIDYAHKGQFDHLGVVSEDPEAILHHGVVIWRPPRNAVVNPSKSLDDPWSLGLWYINTVRSRTGVTVYHDEGRRTLRTNPHPFAGEQIDMGAGRGVSVIVATQGLSGVYRPAFHNAHHWFLFRVASDSERGSLGSSLEIDARRLNLGTLPRLHCCYWKQGMAEAVGPFHIGDLGPRPPR